MTTPSGGGALPPHDFHGFEMTDENLLNGVQ
jgi:hypothetical protein